MKYDGKTRTVKKGANTQDIITALEAAVPTAVAQVQENASKFPKPTGNPVLDAKQAAEFVRDTVKYKADGYLYQDIQLPARMFGDTKKADCKSFALASVAQCLAAGHRCGFRFASYKPNLIPTHVYFYVLDNSGKKHSFDPCIADLKESNKATKIIDMELRYMTGIEPAEIGRRRRRDRKPKSGKGKKIFLAPARGPFLLLVSLNVRGLATKLQQSFKKNPKDTKAFWEKLGGKFDKLQSSIKKGASKKPLFGKGKGIKSPYFENEQGIMFTYGAEFEPSNNIGEPTTATAVATALTAAAPILLAVSKLFKKQGIPEGEGDVLTEEEKQETTPIDENNEGFTVEDSESKTTPAAITTFKPSPLVIGGAIGAIALVYFLTSKKRR
jgi:hypothetical protein